MQAILWKRNPVENYGITIVLGLLEVSQCIRRKREFLRGPLLKVKRYSALHMRLAASGDGTETSADAGHMLV